MTDASSGLPFISAEEFDRQIGPDQARRLLEKALLDGFDPSQDPPRAHVPAGAGHVLTMPSTLGNRVGVKIASVAPNNPTRGLPRIQALYLLLDAETLTPQALIDGVALTSLRTPATTALACDRLAAPSASSLVVFGSGPQAIEHVIALGRIRRLRDIRLVGRNPGRTRQALSELAARGIRVAQGHPDDVAETDIVVCATSATEPVFDSSLVRDGACVAAMGSHEPGRRELEGQLIGRSLVVVEDVATALREAGDIVLAIEEGNARAGAFNDLAGLVNGRVLRTTDRPNVFKGTGMSWQDLAVAGGIQVPLLESQSR